MALANTMTIKLMRGWTKEWPTMYHLFTKQRIYCTIIEYIKEIANEFGGVVDDKSTIFPLRVIVKFTSTHDVIAFQLKWK